MGGHTCLTKPGLVGGAGSLDSAGFEVLPPAGAGSGGRRLHRSASSSMLEADTLSPRPGGGRDITRPDPVVRKRMEPPTVALPEPEATSSTQSAGLTLVPTCAGAVWGVWGGAPLSALQQPLLTCAMR